jgi:hypothetical protein
MCGVQSGTGRGFSPSSSVNITLPRLSMDERQAFCWLQSRDRVSPIHMNNNMNVLYTQVILRNAFLAATQSVLPCQVHTSRHYEKTLAVYAIIIDNLHLLTVEYFVKPACAGASHCSHITAHNTISQCFSTFFSHVPLSQTKHLHVPLDTKDINDMQFLQFQFNFL